uniref:HIT domain-containing protein n=1 Tax=Bacillus glycinifermentans TaxID=1664069 RepID=A0A2I7ZJW2_9BACI|nr:HIT domain-containing protein [Bacillus glycinifermentans]AUS92835.1 hypothetical protein [Bacillus glycinifermentans]
MRKREAFIARLRKRTAEDERNKTEPAERRTHCRYEPSFCRFGDRASATRSGRSEIRRLFRVQERLRGRQLKEIWRRPAVIDEKTRGVHSSPTMANS